VTSGCGDGRSWGRGVPSAPDSVTYCSHVIKYLWKHELRPSSLPASPNRSQEEQQTGRKRGIENPKARALRPTESRQELVTSREPPQLDADGDLDGSRREVLLLLAGLELDQHLVQLRKGTDVSSRLPFPFPLPTSRPALPWPHVTCHCQRY
jgi:hypothetical protein